MIKETYLYIDLRIHIYIYTHVHGYIETYIYTCIYANSNKKRLNKYINKKTHEDLARPHFRRPVQAARPRNLQAVVRAAAARSQSSAPGAQVAKVMYKNKYQ